MTEADIRPLLDAVPFEPFTVHMTSRNSYDIDRPEMVSFSPHGGMHLHGPDGKWVATLSMDHIVRISYPATPYIREG
jgi:hypothetical protein